MSLLEEAQAFTRRPGGTCSVALLVRRLGPEEQAELTDALAAVEIVTAKGIAAALAARGHDIGYHSIGRHRRGDCGCHVAD